MIIDAHMHYADDHPDLLALLAEYDLKFLNICVVALPQIEWHDAADLYDAMSDAYPNRYAWATTFANPDFIDPNWHDDVLTQIDADFARGAIACKVWKNIGMELRKPDGTFAMPDDPIFDPIYEHLAARKKPLIT